MDGIHRDEANAQISIEVLIGRDVPASTLEAHLHVQTATFGDGCDIDILIEDLDVAVGLDHARGHNARLVGAQIERLGTVAVELERDLLQVQDDVGCVFDHAANRLELVQHFLDADSGDCCSLDRAEQGATKGVADRRTKTTLKGLRAELAKLLGKRLGIDCQTLGLLKTSPQHCFFLFLRGVYDAKHSAAATLVILRLD